ncbi:MAG: class I SAM-dependent methyltransferase [Hyphomicrobiaceae bacterium]|nr:class I SAM-dependent methyltransferase [Hyphomicrobiaceae bacterium]MCC0023801.1 class I SAM-dependent methyltransferase [Hyphomicrobiaceae bacterium]
MAYDYDRLYASTPNALGRPTDVIERFFDDLNHRQLRVLDVGCGQGRDAIFIARKGHRVVGVDNSPHGIRDLENAARREDLPIQAVLADIRTFSPGGLFDVILIDRTLHMLGSGERVSTLASLLDHVADDGWLLIADEPSNIPDFRKVLSEHSVEWTESYATRGYLFACRKQRAGSGRDRP